MQHWTRRRYRLLTNNKVQTAYLSEHKLGDAHRTSWWLDQDPNQTLQTLTSESKRMHAFQKRRESHALYCTLREIVKNVNCTCKNLKRKTEIHKTTRKAKDDNHNIIIDYYYYGCSYETIIHSVHHASNLKETSTRNVSHYSKYSLVCLFFRFLLSQSLYAVLF